MSEGDDYRRVMGSLFATAFAGATIILLWRQAIGFAHNTVNGWGGFTLFTLTCLFSAFAGSLASKSVWMIRILSGVALLCTLALAGWVLTCSGLLEVFPVSGPADLNGWEYAVLIVYVIGFGMAGVGGTMEG